MEQTDRSQRGRVWGYWKRLAKEHICIYVWLMNTDNNVMKSRVGAGAGWKGAKERKWETSLIGSTIKSNLRAFIN